MNYVFDIKKKTFSWTKAMKFLQENGFVTIRNILIKFVENICHKCNEVLTNHPFGVLWII